MKTKTKSKICLSLFDTRRNGTSKAFSETVGTIDEREILNKNLTKQKNKMGKDGRILASKRIKDGQEINGCYYRMNYLDKDYKSKDTGELEHLLIFEKENKQARIEVYKNGICFDVRKRNEKEQRYINIDWNEKEIVERVKLTKRKQINELGAVSFVLGLGYKFVRDTFYSLNEE